VVHLSRYRTVLRLYLTKGPDTEKVWKGPLPCVTKISVTGSRAGEGPLGADTADQTAKGSEVYGVYLTKGPVTGRAGEGPLPGVDRAHVVDQMAGGLELSAAHRTQKTFLLLAALLVVPQQRVGKEHI
jgi:hypothetical protein